MLTILQQYRAEQTRKRSPIARPRINLEIWRKNALGESADAIEPMRYSIAARTTILFRPSLSARSLLRSAPITPPTKTIETTASFPMVERWKVLAINSSTPLIMPVSNPARSPASAAIIDANITMVFIF